MMSAIDEHQSSQAFLNDHGPGHARVRVRLGDVLYRYSILWALLIEIGIFSLLRPSVFFTAANARSVISSQAILLLLAIGLTVPLAVNEFDISVEATVVLAPVVMATLVVKHHWTLGLAALAGLGTCALIGGVNAFIVIRIGVNSFIATLGMGTLITGIVFKISNEGPIPLVNDTLSSIATASFLSIQLVFWYGLAATFLLWYVLTKTPLGRRLYFTGSNPEAARLNGVATDRLRAIAFLVSAIVAGLAGILYAGVFGDADPNVGPNFLLPAFAATFLGATSIIPGRFNAWGTFLSVYLVGTGIIGLTIVTQQASWISYVFNGGILIVAVAAQRVVAVRREYSAATISASSSAAKESVTLGKGE